MSDRTIAMLAKEPTIGELIAELIAVTIHRRDLMAMSMPDSFIIDATLALIEKKQQLDKALDARYMLRPGRQ